MAKLRKRFKHVLQNHCSQSTRKSPRKLSSYVVFFDAQFSLMAASQKLIYEFCEAIS